MILAKQVALFLPPIINHVMLSGPNFPALVKYNFGHDFYKKTDTFDKELIGRNI